MAVWIELVFDIEATLVLAYTVAVTVTKVFTLRPYWYAKGASQNKSACRLGVRIQCQARMFSFLCEISLSIAADSGLSTACSIHAVWQQRQPCHRF